MELKTLTASLLAAALSVSPVQGQENQNIDLLPENPNQEGSTAQLFTATLSTITVTFVYNDDETDNQVITLGEEETTITKPEEDPEREGYTFEGWFEEDADSAFDFNSEITASITLYANWTDTEDDNEDNSENEDNTEDTEIYYTVSFESNGGTSIASDDVQEGDKVTKPTDPSRDGYNFKGWYSDEALDTPFNFNTAIEEDTIIYAKWEKINTYTVTFDSQGGTNVSNQTITEGGTVTQPDAPTRSGYYFLGWYSNEQDWNFSTNTITKDTTLYASWFEIVDVKEKFTVTFDTGLGSNVSNQTIEDGSYVVEPNSPTRSGYTFDGWYADDAYNNAWNFTLSTVTSDTTLYAKWTQVVTPDTIYTLSFNSNGGSMVTALEIKEGETATQPSDPTRTNFDFEGWYTDSTLTNPFSFSTKITADTLLHAKWESTVIEYTITFDSNSGTSVSTQTIEEDKLATKPTDPTRTDYSFGGWYTDSDFSTAWSFSSDKVTEDITLYAKWNPVILHTTEGYLYDGYGDSIAGATIKLLKPGSTTTQYSDTTSTSGFYEFHNVSEGFYNLVVTTEDVNRIYAVYIEEKDTEIDNINLPLSQISAYLTMSSTTSVLLVDGLNDVADSIASDESSTSKVNVTLSVTTGDSDEIDEIDEEIENGYAVASYFDLTLKKSVTTSGFTTSDTISETDNLLGFYLNVPTTYRGKDNYVIYRYHDGEVDVITTKKNSNSEQIVVNDDASTIYLTVCQFSTFAIAYYDEDIYDEDLEDEDDDADEEDDNEEDNLVRATILFNGYNMNNENIGVVTFSDANPDEGDTVTITLSPASGFVVSYVYARTTEGKAVAVLKNEDNTYHFIKPEEDVIVTASFALNGTSGNTGSTGGSSGNLANFSYFSDVFITDSYCQAVNEMVRLGLMQGTGDGKFSPHSEITRAMIVQILHNLSGESSNASANFSDVSESDYFYASVNWAKSNGVIAGYDDGTFKPHQPITREELAVILYGYGQRYGYVTNFDNYIFQNSLTFGDTTAISHWAAQAVTWAYHEGVMEERSMNFFSPKAYASRAEVAVTMWNFVD